MHHRVHCMLYIVITIELVSGQSNTFINKLIIPQFHKYSTVLVVMENMCVMMWMMKELQWSGEV